MTPVGGSRLYDGPGLAQWAPWKCPACAAENSGPIDYGCETCGGGSARPRHVGVTPPTPAAPPPVIASPPPPPTQARTPAAAAQAWAMAHPGDTTEAAFLAGYMAAIEDLRGRTMQAPPVTADLPALAPGGKVRRTIIAALELFKDQVLREAQEEIASGEWCSQEEIGDVIRQLRDEEEKERV